MHLNIDREIPEIISLWVFKKYLLYVDTGISKNIVIVKTILPSKIYCLAFAGWLAAEVVFGN